MDIIKVVDYPAVFAENTIYLKDLPDNKTEMAVSGMDGASIRMISVGEVVIYENSTVDKLRGSVPVEGDSLAKLYALIGALNLDLDAIVSTASADATNKAGAAIISAVNLIRGGVSTDGDTLEKLRGLISGLQSLVGSDDVTLDTVQEIVTYIKSEQDLIDSITTSKVSISDIVNVLTSTVVNKPLSAAQGKVLKDALDALGVSVATKVTAVEAAAAAPVQSVAGRSGTVVLNKSDVGLSNVDNVSDVDKPVSTLQALADTAALNAAKEYSDAQDAAQAITFASADIAATTAAVTTIRGGVAAEGDNLSKLYALITAIQTLLGSDDLTLDTVQEIVTYIKSEQSLIDTLSTSKVNIADIINVLTDTSTNKPLSAAQGKILNDALTALSGSAVTLSGVQSMSNKTLSGAVFTDGYTEESSVANVGATHTIDLANGTLHILTLTANTVYTFPTPTLGKSFTLFQKQDATGTRNPTWAASVKWPGGTAPAITTAAGKMDKFVFTADGTNWIGSVAGLNY